MDLCPGSITVEYYDGTSDFTISEASECPSPRQLSPIRSLLPESSSSQSSLGSQSSENKSDSVVSCKTYDFEHNSCRNELHEDVGPSRDSQEGKILTVSDLAREAMMDHYLITQQEHMDALLHPKASFPRCPRGDIPELYSRRKQPGPFLTCSFAHCHECGDDFAKLPFPTKPSPEMNSSTRPYHLKEKKAKFFKQCKNCEPTSFTHHRNPARHYEDYLNNVTYKQHNDHTKVWQQHVVDLMYMLGEESEEAYVDEQIFDQCRNYTPSPSLVKIVQKTTNPQKRTHILAGKRTALTRPLRRPSLRSNVLKASNLKSQSTELQDAHTDSNQKPKQDASSHDNASQDSVKELIVGKLPNVRDLSSALSYESGDDGPERSTELQTKLKSAIRSAIQYKNVMPKVARRFVRKSEHPKQTKYVQKARPNISAKFLRERSKLLNPEPSTPPVKSRDKKLGGPQPKKRPSKKEDAAAGSVKDEPIDGESYAQFRDKNGEFDAEKYRQSILDMLSARSGSKNARKKKTNKKAMASEKSTLSDLPKIRNAYRNVKPKTVTRRQRRRRGTENVDGDILETNNASEVSLQKLDDDDSDEGNSKYLRKTITANERA